MNNNTGQFGTYSVQEWTTTIGINEKSGMDNDEFEIYITNRVVFIFTYANTSMGRESLSRSIADLVKNICRISCKATEFGFLLYPVVPNTTSVSQEMDQKYAPFKPSYGITCTC